MACRGRQSSDLHSSIQTSHSGAALPRNTELEKEIRLEADHSHLGKTDGSVDGSQQLTNWMNQCEHFNL